MKRAGGGRYAWNDHAESLHRNEDSLVRARARRRRLRTSAVAGTLAVAGLVFAWALSRALADDELHETSPASPALHESSP